MIKAIIGEVDLYSAAVAIAFFGMCALIGAIFFSKKPKAVVMRELDLQHEQNMARNDKSLITSHRVD